MNRLLFEARSQDPERDSNSGPFNLEAPTLPSELPCFGHEFGLKPIYFPCYRSVFTLWVDGYDYLENEVSVVSLHLYHGFSYDL